MNTYGTEQSLLENLTDSELVKKFPACYGTRKFITAFTRARHLSLSLARSIQSMPPSNFLKIHPYIFLPSTPVSSKWFLSLRYPHEYPLYTSPLPHTCYILAHLILNLITRTISGEEYRSLSSSPQ